MADKISVSYDANVDDLNRKLDALIAKNQQLSNAANAAQKAMSGLGSSVNATNGGLNQSTTIINNYNNSVNTTNNNVNRLGDSLRKTQKEVYAFEGLLTRVASRMAAVFAVDQVIQFGKSIVDVTRKTELMQNRLNFVFQNAASGEAAFNRLFEVAQKLGIGFQELSEGFVSFGIASRAAGFSAKTTEDIFVRVATALRAAGAGSLQTQRAFYALQQMLSKGVVAAEELRRQLGEALPGASDLMTKAYNRLHPAQQVTNLGFTKLLENGKIISREILPEFSRVLEEEFAPALAGKAGSLDATLTRASNAWDRFKLNIGQTNFQNISSGFKWLEERLTNINTILQNSEGFWQSYYKIVNEVAYGSGLFTVSITDWWKGIMADEKEVAALNQKAFERGSLQYAEGIQNRKELAKMTKQETQDRMKALKSEIDAKTEIAATDEAEAKRQRQRLRGYGMLIEQMQVFAEKENEESQKRTEADNSAKDAIKAREEALAKENLELERLSENSVEYQKQLKRVYFATKNLEELKLAGSPQAFALAAFKLDQKIQEVDKRLGGFDPNVPETIVEPEVTLEPMKRLNEEIKDLTKQQLEDRAAAIQTEIQLHAEGTDRRLELEKALVMAKANLAAKEAEIQGKSVKEIEAIFAQANIKMGELDQKHNDGKKKEAEDYAEFYKRLQDGLDGYEGNSLDKRLKAIREYYGKLIAEAKVYGRTKEEIDALGAKRDQALFEENLKEVGRFVNVASDLYNQFTQIQEMEFNNQKTALDNKLAQGLISEEQYNAEVTRIEKKRFEQNKESQKVNVLINTASAIIRAFSDLGPVGGAIAAAVIGQLAIQQLAAISSSQFPQGFKDGVIDLNGPGTGTSDSIPAMLSRGESVMTARETSEYKPVLQAIRDNNFESFIAKRYINAMDGHSKSQNQGNSFAENILNSFDMQSAEIINAIGKNKRVKIDNVKELASAIFPNSIRGRVVNKKMK
jgi:tape measure domain-containing protein